MYEDMMKDLKDKMQPVVEITEINKKAAEKLIALQTSCVTELFNFGLSQAKALTEIREPKAAVELQVQFYKEVEAKLTDVAEQEIAALTEARDQLTEIFEKNFFDIAELPTTYFPDFGKYVSSVPSFFEAAKAEPQAPAKVAPRKAAPAASASTAA
ncbi:phasin family protein [Marinobacterium aestuariivivens]|uniref:Phasin family protein n=1 Tax=Marinobacterium aestuariivivens TaxID=1698799 RepID=A0ABW2A7B0_9GAMM